MGIGYIKNIKIISYPVDLISYHQMLYFEYNAFLYSAMHSWQFFCVKKFFFFFKTKKSDKLHETLCVFNPLCWRHLMRGINDANYHSISKKHSFSRFINSKNINVFTTWLGTHTLLDNENAFMNICCKNTKYSNVWSEKGNKQ